MPIQFTCPHCGTKSQVAEQYAGQSGPCVACGKPVSIPYAGAGAAAAAAGTGAAVGVSVVAILAVVGIVGVCVVGILVALLLPAVQSAREAARRMQCASNLKQIGMGFHNYHDAHGHFPPAYTVDEDGKPLHSWRVLILPFLEQQALYEQFKLDEPWDSPHNLRLAEMMPKIYQCPSDGGPPTFTDYMVLTGPETIFDGSKSATLNQITSGDGTSQTILVVEAKGATTRWTEPVDIELAKSSLKTIGGPPGDIGSHHPGGAMVLFADATVRYLNKSVPPQTIKALATKNGGEAVGNY